jgi:hypothetical protein
LNEVSPMSALVLTAASRSVGSSPSGYAELTFSAWTMSTPFVACGLDTDSQREEKMKRVWGRAIALTPIGVALLLMVVVGLLLVFLTSGTSAKVGFGVAVAGVLGIVGPNLPAGLSPGRGGGGTGLPRRLREASAPDPEYIESTAPVSEDEWRREQERYRERDQDR